MLNPRAEYKRQHPSRRLIATAAVFVLVFVASLLLQGIITKQEQRRRQQQFDVAAMQTIDSIKKQLDLSMTVLNGGAALFNTLPHVTRQNWHEFVMNLKLDQQLSGLLGIGFAPRVNTNQIAQFEQRAQQDGLSQFRISPLSSDPQHRYFPVFYLEPGNWRNLRAYGFDMASEPHRADAINEAIKQRKAMMTAPVILKQETEGDPHPGLLVYWPVFRADATQSPDADLIGFVYLAVRMPDLMNAALDVQQKEFPIRIHDSEAAHITLFDKSDNKTAQFHYQNTLSFAGRQWHIGISSSPAFELSHADPFVNLIGISGAAVALLAALALYWFLASRQRELSQHETLTEQLAQREEQFRMLFEGAPNAMLMVNAHGAIERFNAQAERLFGFNSSEVIGQSIEILLPHRYHHQHRIWRKQFTDQPSPRQMGSGRELFAVRKDGSEIPVEIGLSPVVTEKGLMTIGSVIDLSARRIAEERSRMIVEASPNAIVLVNAAGKIELVNGQTERLFGYTRQELLGESVEILLPEEHRANHPELRTQYIESPTKRRMAGNRELYARHKSGRSIPVEIGLAPILVAGERYIKAAIVDITERKDAERKLQEQSQQLIMANRYKSEFLANMSHELRTPLNSVLILAEQLKNNKDNNLTAKQVEHADIIYRSGSDLLLLINEILDLSKIEAGRMQIHRERVQLRDVINTVLLAFKPIADNKQLELRSVIDPLVPAAIISDPQRLHQILRNLLSNAIKFTEHGHVELQLRVINAETPQLQFVVSDTGVGIAADDLDTIFVAFRQLDGSSNRRFGGTGLGLTIARQLATLLEGDISVQSTLGGGSQFTLTLPCQIASEVSQHDHVSVVGSSANPVTLLIVEDDKNFASVVSDAASKYGYTSYICHDALSALQILEQKNITAIVLDLLLPDMNGWQLLREIQSNLRTQTIPVHIMSCVPPPPQWQQGHVRYLVKPIDNTTLEQFLQQLVRHPLTTQQSVLLIEDNTVEREHYREILANHGLQVTVASTGQQALQLFSAQAFDCLVVDLNLPDMPGFAVLDAMNRLRDLSDLPIIVNTGLDITQSQLQQLQSFSACIVQKGEQGEQQLLAALHPFLGQIRLPPPPTSSPLLPLKQRKRVLLVDDDVRNIYALTSLIENFSVDVDVAYDGQQAIERVVAHHDIDLILMDMSMPIMDGYSATRLLREQEHCTIPIVALTAHAMPGDREKCLAAGTDDYLAKPVSYDDIERVLNRWLQLQTSERHDG